MTPLRDLTIPKSIGRVEAIIVRHGSRAPARIVQRTEARAKIGLADDRLGQRGESELSTRQVTLIQAEHLPVIAQLAGVARLDPLALRRNLVISGINVSALKNVRVRIGAALLEITGPCHPCSRMEEAIGPGGMAAMRGHGGMCARVLQSGAIGVGDAVQVETVSASPAAAA